MSEKNVKEPTFESNMAALEDLVKRMETGQVGLDQLVKEYEKGSKLLKECEEQLSKAELKISKLKKNGDSEADMEPFRLE